MNGVISMNRNSLTNKFVSTIVPEGFHYVLK